MNEVNPIADRFYLEHLNQVDIITDGASKVKVSTLLPQIPRDPEYAVEPTRVALVRRRGRAIVVWNYTSGVPVTAINPHLLAEEYYDQILRAESRQVRESRAP